MFDSRRPDDRPSLDNRAFCAVLVSMFLLTLLMFGRGMFEIDPRDAPLAAAASQPPCACL